MISLIIKVLFVLSIAVCTGLLVINEDHAKYLREKHGDRWQLLRGPNTIRNRTMSRICRNVWPCRSSTARTISAKTPTKIIQTTPTTVITHTNTNNTSAPIRSLQYNNPHFLSGRSGIVQLFEWKFMDIAQECEDYLGPKGFAGVQVSPVTESIILPHRPWNERYQPISYDIKTRSGDSSNFLEMTSRCLQAGVRVYVDVVLNHMAGNSKGTVFGTGGNYADPKLYYYPGVPYTKDDFHQSPCAVNNTKDEGHVGNCEIEGTHDLDQSRENVRWTIILFLNKLISLGAAGFRIGSANYMSPEDLKYIFEHVKDLPIDFGYSKNSRPFIYQEVENSWKFNYTKLGVVEEFRHPINMAEVFRSRKDVTTLEKYGGPGMGMLPSENSLTFIDSHDVQRKNPNTLTYKSPKELRAAYAYTLAYPYGIPRIMSSFEFDSNQQGPPADSEEDIISPQFNVNGQCLNGWVCEHRWNAISNMIEFRNVVESAPVRRWRSDGEGIFSFCRGNKGFLLINTGRKNFNGEIRTCLPKGVYCDVISGKLQNNKCTGKTIRIDGLGRARRIELLRFDPEVAIALHVRAKIS